MNLLRKDDNTDGSKEAMDHGRMKEIREPSQLKKPQHNLERARYNYGSKQIVKRLPRAVVHHRHAGENHGDNSLGWTVNGNVPAAIESGYHTTNNGRNDSSHRRSASRKCNA